MSDDLSATEAAKILGISLPTLYSYVSRGLLHSSEAAASRHKRYARDAVLHLAARKADGKRAGHQAAAAMHWGVPVLETHISRIADGQLHYRGHNAVALSTWASLEETAWLLWGSPDGQPFDQPFAWFAKPELARAQKIALGMTPIQRAQALLPLFATALPTTTQGTANRFVHAAHLMRLLTALLLGTQPCAAPMHQQLAQHWGVGLDGVNLIRASLVLMAEHELNTSAFTVRCVASGGASLAMALSAGLAALSGPHHGGSGPRVRDAIVSDLQTSVSSGHLRYDALMQVSSTAGFGHPLYPAGDPRSAHLLHTLASLAQASSLLQRQRIAAMAAAAGRSVAAEPNADFALAAIEIALSLPKDACQIMFALGRSAGWIAHAMEQENSGLLIRPRARYVGRYASDT